MANSSKANLEGTLLLTGANGGIATGFLTQFLKSPNAHSTRGYYTVRDPSTAETLRTTLRTHKPPNHSYEIAKLDMSSLKSVREGAKEINTAVASGSLPPIRALVLNAGVQQCELDFTDDGIERTFAINYLHQFLLVLLLLQSMDQKHGRIILIGSTQIWPNWWANERWYENESQKTFFPGSVEELARAEKQGEKGLNWGMRTYAMSKVLLIMFM